MTNTIKVFLCVAIVTPCFGCGESSTKDASLILDNAHSLHRFIASYYKEYNSLPYDSRGADFALYDLKGHVSAAALGGPCNARREHASWNDKLGLIKNLGWHYLNPPPSHTLRRTEIIFVSDTSCTNTTDYIVTLEKVLAIASNEYKNEILLGYYVSLDNFILQDKVSISDWEELFLPSGTYLSNHTNGQLISMRDTHNTIEYKYSYSDNRLTSRTVSAGNLVIVNNIETNADGIITSINTTPKNWKELFAKCIETD